MNGLVLPVVILAAQGVAGLHVQHLAHVPVGARPDQLVAPRLFHPIWDVWHLPLRWVEIERGRYADARADARPAGDTSLVAEHRVPRVIHDQRALADRAGIGAGATRLAPESNAALGQNSSSPSR